MFVFIIFIMSPNVLNLLSLKEMTTAVQLVIVMKIDRRMLQFYKNIESVGKVG